MAFAVVAAPLAGQRPCKVIYFKAGRRQNVAVSCRPARYNVVRAVAADLAAELTTPSAVRKTLLARGWDLAWIDGVTGEMMKGKLQTSVPQMEAAISYLESLGIPTKSVENMASLNKQILAQPVEALQDVVVYAQRQGASGNALVVLLEAHPNLLTYRVSADGRQLEKGAARASIDVVERDGLRVAGVSYWREGAAFSSAPVAPYKPSAL